MRPGDRSVFGRVRHTNPAVMQRQLLTEERLCELLGRECYPWKWTPGSVLSPIPVGLVASSDIELGVLLVE